MWNEALDNELADLINMHGTKWQTLAELFSVAKTATALKMRWQNYLCENPKRGKPDYMQVQEPSNPILKQAHKRTHQFHADGTQTDIRIVPEEALETPETLLRAHNYNPLKFKLKNSTSNYWDMADKELGIKTLYQSKITVEPIAQAIDWEAIADTVASKIEPRSRKAVFNNQSDRYLTINLFDLHFGNMTLDDYDSSIDKIFTTIENNYKEILIISGGDLLNENDFRGQTAKGTNIGRTNMEQAWEDAFDMLDMLIHKSTDHAERVKLMYVPGNHDEHSGNTVIRALRRIYERQPNVYIDCEQKMFKATLLGHNFIGATHGDRSNKKKYPQIFATMFSQLWGAEGVFTREMFSGHLHNEHVLDDGLLMRQMPTRNHLDDYHKQNGFVTAHRRLQLVEYSEYETEVIYYA